MRESLHHNSPGKVLNTCGVQTLGSAVNTSLGPEGVAEGPGSSSHTWAEEGGGRVRSLHCLVPGSSQGREAPRGGTGAALGKRTCRVPSTSLLALA